MRPLGCANLIRVREADIVCWFKARSALQARRLKEVSAQEREREREREREGNWEVELRGGVDCSHYASALSPPSYKHVNK